LSWRWRGEPEIVHEGPLKEKPRKEFPPGGVEFLAKKKATLPVVEG